jgi:hypothetical protein
MTSLREMLKAILPKGVRAAMRTAADRSTGLADHILEAIGRRCLKSWRLFFRAPRAPGIDIAMLCIRRPVYVRLAISSINSLHYQNHRHRIRLHLDQICEVAFQKCRYHLDYPETIETILVEDDTSQPWQFTKLEVVLGVSSKGIPFVDADSRWHTDPALLIQPDRTMFLVEVNKFRAVAFERILVEEALHHPEWIDRSHFNTGFLAIPVKLFSARFAAECRSIAREIYDVSGRADFTPEQQRMLKHTCEELALSLAAQSVMGNENISTMKDEDGPGSRRRLESYYYGALHNVD